MFEEYADILTAEEACEALRIGYNAIYELLNSGKLKGYRSGAFGGFRRWPFRSIFLPAPIWTKS